VLEALGPRTTVGSISLRFPSLVLEDVRITADGAPYAWPAQDEARAKRVEFTASVANLWAAFRGEPLHVDDIVVEDGYLSALRTRGHLMLLPALREQARARAAHRPAGAASVEGPAGVLEDESEDAEDAASAPPLPGAPAGSIATAASAATPASAGASYPAPGPLRAASGPHGESVPVPRRPTLVLEHLRFERMQVDAFDATLPHRPKPYRVELDNMRAELEHVLLPTLDEPILIDLQGRLKGVDGDAPVSIKGRFTPRLHDADLDIRTTGADLIVLQPYLLRFGEGGVRHGRMDLQLDAHVVHQVIHAPGHLTITGLEFTDQGGTFAGVERRAVMAALTKNGRIDVKFTLDGRLDDPRFALDEGLGKRFAAGLAEVVGVSVKGVVESVGDAIKGLFGGGSPPPPRKP
jgi:hypothetical protein